MDVTMAYIAIFSGMAVLAILIVRFVILDPPLGSSPEECCWSGKSAAPDADCRYCDHWRECDRYGGPPGGPTAVAADAISTTPSDDGLETPAEG